MSTLQHSRLARQHLKLEANDLYPFASGSRHVSVVRQMLDMWRIPLVKRTTTTICFVSFLVVFIFGFAFLPMCGPLTLTHVIAAAWLLTIGGEELYLASRSVSLWKSNRQARLFMSSLVLLFLGCLLRWHQRDAHLRTSNFEPASVTRMLFRIARNGTLGYVETAPIHAPANSVALVYGDEDYEESWWEFFLGVDPRYEAWISTRYRCRLAG